MKSSFFDRFLVEIVHSLTFMQRRSARERRIQADLTIHEYCLFRIDKSKCHHRFIQFHGRQHARFWTLLEEQARRSSSIFRTPSDRDFGCAYPHLRYLCAFRNLGQLPMVSRLVYKEAT